jgi:hydroxymethylbilane synthase
MGDRVTADLSAPTLLYAVSQGALAVEVRSDDKQVIEMCKLLTHKETQWRCLAERACLRVLEGGCSVPVGVTSVVEWEDRERDMAGVLSLTGSVTSIDGQEHVENTLKERVSSTEDAEELGARLAKILIESGAKKILEDINNDRERRIDEAKTADAAQA